MDKLREVTEYMNQMKIKKALFGGYDKNDVNQKMDTMIELFMECVKKNEAEETAIIKDCEKRMSAQAEKISDLTRQIAELTEEQERTLKEAAAEKEKMKAVYKERCSSILTEYSDSIRSLSVEFTHVLENVAKLQKELKENAIFEQIEVDDEK